MQTSIPIQYATPEEIFGAPISVYSRAQAIEDGLLVDVSHATDEHNRKLSPFKFPVALTRAVYEATIATGGTWRSEGEDCTEALLLPGGQSTCGRLWDVFMVLHHAIRASSGPCDRLPFSVLVDVHGNGRPRRVRLVGTVGPGDLGEPVITIMLPEED